MNDLEAELRRYRPRALSPRVAESVRQLEQGDDSRWRASGWRLALAVAAACALLVLAARLANLQRAPDGPRLVTARLGPFQTGADAAERPWPTMDLFRRACREGALEETVDRFSGQLLRPSSAQATPFAGIFPGE